MTLVAVGLVLLVGYLAASAWERTGRREMRMAMLPLRVRLAMLLAGRPVRPITELELKKARERMQLIRDIHQKPEPPKPAA